MTSPSTSDTPLAEDLLDGAAEIAEFLFGETPGGQRKVYHLAGEVRREDRIPIFRLGNGIAARKSTLLAWIADRERAEREREPAA